MRQQAFLQWLGQLDRLTPRQRRQVSAKLNTTLPKHASGSDTATLIPPPDHCPHCLRSTLRPWSTSHGLARYRGKQCGRTCNALSGTALARLRHKDHWPNYAKALIQGESVRMAAQRCGVDKNTAFRWRLRFLHYAADHRAEQEAGIVEADETFFLESFKGQRSLPRPARSRGGVAHKRGINAEQIPVLVVRDRQGRTADFKLARRMPNMFRQCWLHWWHGMQCCVPTVPACMQRLHADTVLPIARSMSATGDACWKGLFTFRM